MMMMAGLPDGNQRGQRVTDHWQPEGGKPSMRAGSQFEGQRKDVPPRVRSPTQPPSQRAHRQDGNGKGAVLAVAGQDGGGERVRLESAGMLLQPLLGLAEGDGIFLRGLRHRPEGCPTKQGGAQVAEAEIAVAPSAVGIGVGREPSEPGMDLRFTIYDLGFEIWD